MKLYICMLVAVLAMTAPAQALLGVKLALLGVLRNSLYGGENLGGYGGGYGNGYGGGYGNSYSGGYGNGGYTSGITYNRPVYTGQTSNYGWGQQYYGGGYSGGYNAGYNGEKVKIIKVIVNHEQPQSYYDDYARSSSAASLSSISTSSGPNWTPIPAPAPVVQTYATEPVQPVQVSAPAQVQVPIQTQAAAPLQVIQPPPRPVYIQSPQPAYQQVTVQRPIYQKPQVQPAIKLIVDGQSQHYPAQIYGPPQLSPNYVAPSVNTAGGWNSDSWSSGNSGNGWSNVGTGPWKNGRISEGVGC